jgi:DNA helicase-2/ATP-dependent DNA helicase PcrA
MMAQTLDSPAILESLNPTQAEAVQAIEGPVLVLAGPGSGKTRVLTHRIAYLVRVCGVRPYNILAVTFTNKAAKEMISRLHELIGDDASRLTVGTFHAICARILRREGAYLGLSSSFVIYDEDDQIRLVTRILKELNLDDKLYRPAAVHGAISRAKNELITAETYNPPSYWHEAVARAFAKYEELKNENNALDFDDLLLKAEQLLRLHPEVREQYQKRYQFVLVDEFQDTNKAQYELISHLAGESRNVFVVGDEDQSIYSWRGADFRNVLLFRADFPDAKVFLLERNYRSTQTVLDAAQAVIAHNTQRVHKNLWTETKGGPPIHVFEAYDEREEAEYVVTEIQRLISRGGLNAGDCAVMFRTNAQSRVLEDAFVRHGVAYRLVGGTRFYQRREIKDILAYLRVIQNPDDDVSLGRIINVPPRGVGDKTLAQLSEWADSLGMSPGRALMHLAEMGESKERTSGHPFVGRAARNLITLGLMLQRVIEAKGDQTISATLGQVIEQTGYIDYLRDGTEEGEDRANNVQELYTVTDGYGNMPPQTALPSFLEEVALVSDTDDLDAQADAVTLLTLHTAKGLEYQVVFIVGMEEGICPHSRSMDSPDAMEEERRLCYVGLTRAKRHLYLLRAFRRTLYGTSNVRDPSRFLLDIPPHLLEGNVVRGSLARSKATSAAPLNREERRTLIDERRNRIQRSMARRQEEEKPRPARREAPASRPSSPAFAENSRRPTVPRSSPGSHGAPAARPSGARVRPDEQRGRSEPASDPAGDARVRPGRQAHQEPTYKPGQKVIHPIFGQGTVIESKVVGDDEEVTVAFAAQGIKRLMASYARLEKG